jgi:exodeoxyribonuclease VII large subunit
VHDIAVPVSILVREIKNAVEGAFGFVAVTGELTNLSKAYSGHTYFTLKEGDAQIKCAFFKSQQKMNQTELKEDSQFIVYGRVSIYEPRSEISLIVNLIIPYGEGIEALKLKALKEKLYKEGVFDQIHKKDLPDYPSTVGVVTSRGGAAIHDIINVSRKRFPPAEIILSPSLVQGKGADRSIVEALEKLSEIKGLDVIIVGRGGGLKEDMDPFNSEMLAYSVINCSKPVVSAVGHETDSTILDMAASFSVATPTAAAELIFPDKKSLISDVSNKVVQAENNVSNRISSMMMHLDNLVLSIKSPDQIITENLYNCDKLMMKADKHISQIFFETFERLSKLEADLAKNDPFLPMNKGFALIRQKDKTVPKLSDFNKSEPFSITFIDGKTEIKNRENK